MRLILLTVISALFIVGCTREQPDTSTEGQMMFDSRDSIEYEEREKEEEDTEPEVIITAKDLENEENE